MKHTIQLTEDDVKQAILDKYGGESVEIKVGTTSKCVDQWRNEYTTYGVFKEAVVTIKNE